MADPADPPSSRRWAAGLVLAGTVLLSLQGGLLRVALPVVRRELDTGVAGIQAVSLAGLLVVTASLVAFGRLADLAGPPRIYAAGLAGFAGGAALSAAAPSTGWLVAAQALQGVGWSMCVGASPVILVGAFRPGERGRVLAGNHMAVAVGLAGGPAAGGLVVEHLGWRAGFGMLAPAALVLAVLVLARLPSLPARSRRRLDLPGAGVLAAALVGLLLVAGGRGGLLLAVGSAGALAAFALLQARSPDPLVDLRLFADRGFSAGLAATFLNFIAMASNMFLVPFFLQDHLREGPARAGAMMMVVPVVILLAAPMAGVLSDRTAPRVPATLGLALVTAAVLLMSRLGEGSSVVEVGAVLAVYGLGAALFQSPNTAGILAAAPADRLGVASGTLATVARLGQVAGVAVAGGAWRAGLERHGETAMVEGPAFRDAFLVLAAFGLLAAAASWLRGGRRAARQAMGEPSLP